MCGVALYPFLKMRSPFAFLDLWMRYKSYDHAVLTEDIF